jgi:parallel beta-helix repeat protein
MIDWDLEAPGLHLFFRDFVKKRYNDLSDYEKEYAHEPGLIDVFIEIYQSINDTNLEDNDDRIVEFLNNFEFDKYIIETDIKNLYIIKAGRFDDSYSSKINTFKWRELFEQAPNIFQILAEQLATNFRYTLIDSRTGMSDTSGICTMLMPDKLVVVFTPNRQSLTGLANLVQQATQYRKQSDDLRPLTIFPLASRVELAERKLYEEWRFGNNNRGMKGYQFQFQELLKKIYGLPNCNLNDYFDDVQIQHVPAYAFGEEIAVLVERGRDRLSAARSYLNFTDWLVNVPGPWESPEKRITMPSLPTTHIVDINSHEGHRSIERAIKTANAGDKILVRPGVYKETIVINKSIEITGEGNKDLIIVESGEDSVLIFNATSGRVSNLSLVQLENAKGYCVEIVKGELDLDGCNVSSSSYGCIVVRGGAKPRIRNNRIYGSKKTGILIFDKSEGVIENNDIYDHRSVGVEIADKSNPIIRSNRIYKNNENGIHIYNEGRGIIEDSDIFLNSQAGISIMERGNPLLRRNKIHDGGRGGILIQNSGYGIIEDNEIFSNVLSNVEITENSNPVLQRNRIYSGKRNGILIISASQGMIENNDIYSNALENIEIGMGSNPIIRGNSIYDAKQSGIHIHGNSHPIIEDNEIFSNARAGVRIKNGANPSIRRNRIHDDKGAGIFILENGRGTIEENDIFNNSRAGIAIEGGDAVLRRNRINKNGFEAVCVRYKSSCIIEDNDLRENTKGALDFSEDSRSNLKITGNLER